MNKKAELDLAKGILDRVTAAYPTMFSKDGYIKRMGYGADTETCPTRVKEELRFVRRLLLEVEKAL